MLDNTILLFYYKNYILYIIYNSKNNMLNKNHINNNKSQA